MSGMAAEPDTVPSKPNLVFHPDFNVKQAGDIILRSDDDISFYFRLSHLAALSSFFSTLPPPSDDDLVDGTPLIPLEGSTQPGLLWVLLAVRSTLSFEAFCFPTTRQSVAEPALLHAAMIARKYDLPIVVRVLHEGLTEAATRRIWIRRARPYLTFAVWAIAGVEGRMAAAAGETLGEDVTPISCISDTITKMCKAHASTYWLQLLELHHRHFQAITRFHLELGDLSLAPFHSEHEECGEQGGVYTATSAVVAKLYGAQTLKEVLELSSRCYGLSCDDCCFGASERYDSLVRRMKVFSTSFVLDSTC